MKLKGWICLCLVWEIKRDCCMKFFRLFLQDASYIAYSYPKPRSYTTLLLFLLLEHGASSEGTPPSSTTIFWYTHTHTLLSPFTKMFPGVFAETYVQDIGSVSSLKKRHMKREMLCRKLLSFYIHIHSLSNLKASHLPFIFLHIHFFSQTLIVMCGGVVVGCTQADTWVTS